MDTSTDKIKRILVFIPARNEAASVGEVINNIRPATMNILGSSPDVLVIDDGSSDNTSQIARDNGAIVIQHEINIGLGNAFREAVNFALDSNYDLMLTIDGDGQFDEKEAGKLIKQLAEGYDFATGSRFLPDSKISGMPKIKILGNRLMSKLISSILGKIYFDVSCGYRVYNRKALLHLNLFGGFTYTQEVFLNLGYKKIRIKEVPISVKYFSDRKSRIASNLFVYGRQTTNIIFQSVIYYRPMKLFGALSALLFTISFPVATIITIRYYLTDLITPYKGFGIASVLFLILSFISLIVGIILQNTSRLQLSIDELIYLTRKNGRH